MKIAPLACTSKSLFPFQDICVTKLKVIHCIIFSAGLRIFVANSHQGRIRGSRSKAITQISHNWEKIGPMCAPLYRRTHEAADY